MKVAVITVTYKDDYKLKEWIEYYQLYKDEIYIHIIVDNGSPADYLKLVENSFPDSMILKRATNGGLVVAYNDGIKRALIDKEVDAVMLIGNDIRLERGGIKKLYEHLYSKEYYGMVAPVMLVKDSTKIEDMGSKITTDLYMDPLAYGQEFNQNSINIQTVEAVTGGMNLAKRSFYESVGLQDENLFMYSDEVDMGLRAKKCGYKMGILKDVRAWHQHINPPGKTVRKPYSAFLIGRNKIYLAYKHFGIGRAFYVFLCQMRRLVSGTVRNLFSREILKFQFYFLFGTLCGIFRINKNFNFIINNY